MPFNKFTSIVDGVYNTINYVEQKSKKAIIEEKLKDNNLMDLEIDYDKSYFLK